MKLTKNQNMQQHKTPAAADGIIKNHAPKHTVPELCQSIIQLISTNNTGEEHKLTGSLHNTQREQFIVEKNIHDKTEKRKATRKIQRRIKLEQFIGGHIGLVSNTVTTVACRLSTGVKSEKTDKRGKIEPDTSSAEAASSCRCTFLLLIFVTHSINEIGNITEKKERKQKNLHHPITIFLKKNPSTRDTRQASPMQNGGKIVSKKKNGLPYHFRLDPKIPGKLDTVITRMGYTSRGEYFNAVAQFTVKEFGNETANKDGEKNAANTKNGDAKVPDLPSELKTWIENQKPPLTEDEIKKSLEETIRTMLFPVIALRGADISHETAWKNIRSIFHEEHGMWLTESDIREAIEEFASVHHGELTDYRNKTLEGEQV